MNPSRHTRRDWTGAEVNRLRSLWRGGASLMACARILGRDRRSIAHALNRHHMRREHQRIRGSADARTELQIQIDAAIAERDTAPPYKPGPLQW
jgi:hypothetical protein